VVSFARGNFQAGLSTGKTVGLSFNLPEALQYSHRVFRNSTRICCYCGLVRLRVGQVEQAEHMSNSEAEERLCLCHGHLAGGMRSIWVVTRNRAVVRLVKACLIRQMCGPD